MINLGAVETALDTLNARAPELFSRSLLIGGWCALIYYQSLVDSRDPDHPAPVPESRERLISKDIDFTNVWSEDFFDALPDFVVHPDKGAPYLKIGEIRLGFAQVPEAIDPEEAFEKSRKLRTRAGTIYSLLDPVRLYRGKLAMIQKGRGKANDTFHLQIASTYARFELAEAIRMAASNPEAGVQVDVLTQEIRDLAPELLRD